MRPRSRSTQDESLRESDFAAVANDRGSAVRAPRANLRDIVAAWAIYAILLGGLVLFAAIADMTRGERVPAEAIKAQSGDQVEGALTLDPRRPLPLSGKAQWS